MNFDARLLTFFKTICTTCPKIFGLILLVITKTSHSCLRKTPVNNHGGLTNFELIAYDEYERCTHDVHPI